MVRGREALHARALLRSPVKVCIVFPFDIVYYGLGTPVWPVLSVQFILFKKAKICYGSRQ